MRGKYWLSCWMILLLAAGRVSMAADPPRAPVSRTPPAYPALAKKMRIWGEVQVEVTVEPDGSVTHAKAIYGHPLLQGEAERAIMKWRFAPGPKESTFLVAVNFKLD